jgi:hypothetical protein
MAPQRKGASQSFQTIAILGFAADARLLSASEMTALKDGLGRLAGRAPVVNGIPMGFPADAVGVLGVALGTAFIADPDTTRRVADWAARFLKSSYERDRAEDWERCLLAAADRKIGHPLGLAIPVSVAVADVRIALLSVDLLDHWDVELQQDATLTLTLGQPELPKDLTCERAALRLKALERAPHVLSASAAALRHGPDVHVSWGSFRTGGILSFRNEGTETAKNVRLRCSGDSSWRPILRPDVVASISPGATVRVVDETAQKLGDGQSIADFVHSLPSKEHTMAVIFEDWLGEKRERDFRVVAMEKRGITESPAVTFYAGALRKIDVFNPASADGLRTVGPVQVPPASNRLEPDKRKDRGTEPTRRNPRYRQIDTALKETSGSRPRTQEEVFQSLDDRHVSLPLAEPFLSARGWTAAFRRDPLAARSWLSKRWSELKLAPLPRGPKSQRK